MNFLKKHIIGKILNEIIKIKESNKKKFLFFDEPIIEGKYKIDRVNIYFVYQLEQILPITWSSLKGTTLIKIYQKLKQKKFKK